MTDQIVRTEMRKNMKKLTALIIVIEAIMLGIVSAGRGIYRNDSRYCSRCRGGRDRRRRGRP